jgi:hypothetical protein
VAALKPLDSVSRFLGAHAYWTVRSRPNPKNSLSSLQADFVYFDARSGFPGKYRQVMNAYHIRVVLSHEFVLGTPWQ